MTSNLLYVKSNRDLTTSITLDPTDAGTVRARTHDGEVWQGQLRFPATLTFDGPDVVTVDSRDKLDRVLTSKNYSRFEV